MKTIFMGTPFFAVPALKALHESKEHNLVAVITRADAIRGRGKKLIPSEVKQFALEHDIDVYTPQTLCDEQVQTLLKKLAPDIIIVAAYGAILPKEVLVIPPFGCINLHASLLPSWRGAAPIQRAILSGDKEAGICLMKMEEGLDTGNYVEAGRVLIEDKSYEQITAELAELGAQALLNYLPQIQNATLNWQVQDESKVTYAEKISKHEVLLNPSLSAEENLARIQVSSKSFPARCLVCGKEVTVCKACKSSEKLQQGEVLLPKKRVILGTCEGSIELLEVKPMGKQAMPVVNWRAGLRVDDAYWEAVEQYQEMN